MPVSAQKHGPIRQTRAPESRGPRPRSVVSRGEVSSFSSLDRAIGNPTAPASPQAPLETSGAGSSYAGLPSRVGHDFSRIPVHGQAVVPPIVHDALQSLGRPLDMDTRAFFEPRFNHDFGHVRVHTDPKAVASAQAVRALAYTVGRDVVFGGGQFSPRTSAGLGLIAHELAHVVQQTSGPAQVSRGLAIDSRTDTHEREADRISDAIVRRRSIPARSWHPSPPMVARRPDGPRDATAAERRDIVYAAARFLDTMASQIEDLRRVAARALATTQGSAAAPRAFHQYLNQGVVERMLPKAISVFEAQRSHVPGINFPAESPEQTRLGEAYARVMEQFGLAIEEARANAANLAPAVRAEEERKYDRNHLRWLETNPSAPLAAGIRTTFTQTELDVSARRHQQVSTELTNLVARIHLHDLSGNRAERLRGALLDATYRLVRDPSSGRVRPERDAALVATIQPVLDQLDGIGWAIAQAVGRLQQAETRTRAFATNPAGNPAVGATLQSHFSTRDPGYATLLANRLARMARELRGEGTLTVHARDPQDPACVVGSIGGGISVTVAHADANRFHFCGNVMVGDQGIVSTVIHETVHAVIPNLGAGRPVRSSTETPGDRAYAYERIYSRLSTEEALDNAESYSFYVDALLGVAVHRPSAPTDSVTGCTDADTVRDAIARATYRIRLGAMWASQTIAIHRGAALPQPVIDSVRVGFPGADQARAQEVLRLLRDLASALAYTVSVVCRPASDAEARRGALVYGPANRATADGLQPTTRRYPGASLRICPDWFQADIAVREDALTSILVLRYAATAPAADARGLVAMLRNIQEEVQPSVAGRTLQQHQAADAPPAPTP